MKIDNDQKFSQSYLESKIIQYLQYKWGYILKDRELSVPMRCGYEQVDIDIIYTNSIFFMWQTGKKMMWIRISVRKRFNWIHVAMQEICCSSSAWRWHHVFFLFNYYFSSVAFYPLQKILYNLTQRDPV